MTGQDVQQGVDGQTCRIDWRAVRCDARRLANQVPFFFSSAGVPPPVESLNTHTEPPCSSMLTFFATSPPQRGTAPPQPDITAMYCVPPSSQVTGGATTPDPVWNCHRTLPLLASAAFK